MTRKEIAIKTIQCLPDSATWADIEERIGFLAGIDNGLADIKAGRVVPHEQVRGSPRGAKCRSNLRGLVDRIPPGYRPGELDWTGPTGNEAW